MQFMKTTLNVLKTLTGIGPRNSVMIVTTRFKADLPLATWGPDCHPNVKFNLK